MAPRPLTSRASGVAVVALLTAGVLGAGPGTTRADAAGPAPLPTPTCQPWQTPTTVPVGVTLTPRVFPPAAAHAAPHSETPAAPAPLTTRAPTTRPAPAATTSPRLPPRRIVCRNAAPAPFAHPAWRPDTVVGGPRLAASGVVVDLGTGAGAPPEVYDVSYVVADLATGEILAAKSPHAWLRPASTLKTLTALTLLPRLDPKAKVTATEEMQQAAGTRVGIIAKNPYPVANLFDALLMFSANDAAYALAEAGGGYARTVALMNAEARRIGAHDTVTVDPSGLDEGNQRSSAYDLAVIGRAAMRLPAFRTTAVKREAMFPGGTDRNGKKWPAFQIHNINDLLSHYPGAVGIKPGRTNRAQHTFIGAATRGGRTLIVSQMGSVTGAWQPTGALLDWGFANAARVVPVGRLVDPGDAAPPRAAPPAGAPTSLTAAATPRRPGSPSSTTGAVGAGAQPAARPPTPVALGPGAPAPGMVAAGAGTQAPPVAGIVLGVAWLGVAVGIGLGLRRLLAGRRRRDPDPT